MRTRLSLFGVVLLAAACGGGTEKAAPAVTVTVTSPVPTIVTSPPTTAVVVPPPTTEARPPTTEPPVAAAPAAPSSFVMPNEIGKDLQTAQDEIQSVSGNPIFFSHSHDASGRNRLQILDRDWTVCSQNVPPGSPFTADSTIDFGVVKLSERC